MNIPDVDAELKEIFIQRGMVVDSDNANIAIKNIGYYKLKEYARPFMDEDSYHGLLFSSVLKRYFFDKNLRIHLLHIIEMIELAFKNSLAEFLGDEYGPFGYLDFLTWSDQETYTTEYIIEKQVFIKRAILKGISSKNQYSNPEYFDEKNLISKGHIYNKESTSNHDSLPTVWLALDLLSFGQLHHLYKLLPLEGKTKIADSFNCGSQELNSWIGSMVLVRNVCAHSSNLIDIEFQTLPRIKRNWETYLQIQTNDNGKKIITKKLASVIIPIVYLAHRIDEDYGFGDIYKDIRSAIKPVRKNGDNQAQSLGFRSKRAMEQFFSEFHKFS